MKYNHSFNPSFQCILSILRFCYVTGTVWGIWDISMNKKDKNTIPPVVT